MATIGDKNGTSHMTQTIRQKVLSRVYGKKRGAVVTPIMFQDLCSQKTAQQTLLRLCDEGIIRRLAPGLYDYPRTHPKLGVLAPSPDTVAKALATNNQLRIQPTGAYAANLLGLSLQVPARIVFLTDGASRIVKIGNQEFIFKRTTPKNMAAAGRVSGLVIQALRYLGQANVDDPVIKKLDAQLRDEHRRVLLRDIGLAPAWIANIIRRLTKELT